MAAILDTHAAVWYLLDSKKGFKQFGDDGRGAAKKSGFCGYRGLFDCPSPTLSSVDYILSNRLLVHIVQEEPTENH